MTKKLKIAHLTSVHKDGDTRIFHKECVSLARAGHEVYLIVPNTESRIEKGVNIISFAKKKPSRIHRMIAVVNQVYKKAVELDADVYHLHDPELLRIAKKLMRKGKVVIYDSHEDLPAQMRAKTYLPSFSRKILSKMVESWENDTIKKISGVVAATPYIRERFVKINKNSIDINNYPLLSEMPESVDYPSKKGNKICYVGGITRPRGPVELMQALDEVGAELLLAGNFLEQGLEKELKAMPAWNKVTEKGFLDRAGVSKVYLESKVGIVTLHPIINYLDALPVKMFEYMMAGLPVIASDFPLWKSIVELNNAGLCVNPLVPKEIANAIKYLLDHPKEAQEMGENGRKLVLEKCNWEIEQSKLLNFYYKLTN